MLVWQEVSRQATEKIARIPAGKDQVIAKSCARVKVFIAPRCTAAGQWPCAQDHHNELGAPGHTYSAKFTILVVLRSLGRIFDFCSLASAFCI